MDDIADFDFNLLSLNVRGINNSEKRKAIFRWIKQQKSDIIFLQETYSNFEDESIWQKDWGSTCYFTHGSKHRCGLMIMFDERLDVKIETIETDPMGRYIFMKTQIQDNQLYLLNIYAPNKVREQTHFLIV